VASSRREFVQVSHRVHHGAGTIRVRNRYRHPCISLGSADLIFFTITRAFSNTYNDDKTRFGDPAKSTYKVVEVKNLDSWQTVLLAHAKNVQPPNFKKRKAPPA